MTRWLYPAAGGLVISSTAFYLAYRIWMVQHDFFYVATMFIVGLLGFMFARAMIQIAVIIYRYNELRKHANDLEIQLQRGRQR